MDTRNESSRDRSLALADTRGAAESKEDCRPRVAARHRYSARVPHRWQLHDVALVHLPAIHTACPSSSATIPQLPQREEREERLQQIPNTSAYLPIKVAMFLSKPQLRRAGRSPLASMGHLLSRELHRASSAISLNHLSSGINRIHTRRRWTTGRPHNLEVKAEVLGEECELNPYQELIPGSTSLPARLTLSH
jgi:hypothetical protein